MNEFTKPKGDGFVWNRSNEQVWIVPWGKNGLRVRITREAEFRDLPQGLIDSPPATAGVKLDIGDSDVKLTNGKITVKLEGRLAQLSFIRTSDDALLLKERRKTCLLYTSPSPRDRS